MAMFKSLHEGDAAPELATALGDMILAWTQAEEEQILAMSAMLDMDPNDALRFYQNFPNFRSRTQMLYTLLDIYPDYEPIRIPIAALSKLSKTRNRYVHGGYISQIGDPSNIRSIDYAQADHSDSRSKPIKAADVKNHSNAVRTRAEELSAALVGIPDYIEWQKTPLRDGKESPSRRRTQSEGQTNPESSAE